MMDKFEMMSNAELKIRMKEMEFEYEALKMKIKECMTKMEELDGKYNTATKVMQKRLKGWV